MRPMRVFSLLFSLSVWSGPCPVYGPVNIVAQSVAQPTVASSIRE
jgi:hypothetical protein